MFDLRYHVASLAAVFVALVIGILVGVGHERKASTTPRSRRSKSDVNRLDAQLNAASEGRAKVSREHTALRAFIKNAYPTLIANRLHGKRVAVLFVGSVDAGVDRAIEQAVSRRRRRRADAPARAEAPDRPDEPRRAPRRRPGPVHRRRRHRRPRPRVRARARERRRHAAWDALTSQLVEEKAGSFRKPVDGVVVARTRQAAERSDGDVSSRRLRGPRRRRGPDGRGRAVGASAARPFRPGARTGCRPSTTSTRRRAASRSRCSWPAVRPGTTA